MNTRLKQLAAQNGMPFEKISELARLVGDEFTEELLMQATYAQKSADSLGIAYKVAQGGSMGTPRSNDLVAQEAAQLEVLCDGLPEEATTAVFDVWVPRGFKEAAQLAVSLKARHKAAQMDPFEALVKGFIWDGR